MRSLIACMVLLLVWCGVAGAKTRVGTGGNVHAVADPDGTAHVLWRSGNTITYCRVAPGTEACAATRTWSSAGGDIDIVRAPAGAVHVLVSVWFAGGDFGTPGLWDVVLSGGTWAAPKRITNTVPGNSHQGTIFGPGEFQVGWLTQVGTPTGARLTFGTTNSPGVSQGAVDLIVPGSYEADVGLATTASPVVVSRSTGTGITAYQSHSGAGDVRNVANWRAAKTLGDVGPTIDLAANALAAPALVSYQYVAGTDWRINVRRYDHASDAFGAPVVVNEDDETRDVWAFLDSASNVHALWRSGSPKYRGAASAALVYSASATGEAWPKNGIVLDQGMSNAVPALAAGSGGAGVAAWTRDAGDGSTDDDEVWLGAIGGPGSAFPPDPPPPDTPPPPVQPPPVDPSCVKQPALGVAKLLATGCFKKTTGSKLTTTQPFLVNGITVDPGGKTVTVDTAKRTLAVSSASVAMGVIKLGKAKLDWTFPASGTWTRPGGAIDLDAGGFGGELLGLKITGDATLKLTDGKALLTGFLRLPAPFDGVTAQLDFRSDNFTGLQLQGLKSHIDELGLGFHDLDLEYTSDPPTWTGKLKFQPSVLEGSGTDFEGEIRLVNGTLDKLAIAAKFDAPGRELYPPLVYLRYAGLDLEVKPLQITGKVIVAGGASPTDTPIISVGRPYDDFGILKLRLASPFSLRAEGPVYVLGTRVGGGFFQYTHKGVIDFGADAKIGSCDGGIAGAEASVKGFVDVSGGLKMNAKGEGRACLGALSASATAVVSSKGMAACADFKFPPISAGAGIFWGDALPDLKPLLCKTKPYEVAQAAQAGGPIQVGAGLRQLNVIVTGDAGVPVVTLVGPNGLRYAGAASGVVSSATGVSVGEPALKRQTFMIARPPAGAWALELAPGSPGVTGVQVARDAPALKVTGRVERGELRWKQSGGSGQVVSFYEQGDGVFRRLGVARGASGTLRWKPAAVRGGRRTVIAVGELDGLASDQFTLGSFTLPRPAKPGIARRLKAAKRAGALRLTWVPGRGAARQEVRVQLSNGIGLVERVSGRTRRLRVPGVAKGVTGRVTVVGLRADGVAGKTARVVVRR
ncbi:hypothetical protein DVA67_014925 [Solirubrobacter sp. CPCC 204708]|uniref:Uncharacterized protein n=1 Tax=Solirubrobacter deserti TaxID=2282478 RepID=A0ABT4RUA9_9ACTN|nr:hypothetical protein [Solirubrobacter deserti]MBE2317273.1 hypothetical protein [Solirubrobacter deserti]MDA0142040.1 hypothetical protein [Solirubrobacter deserti]